MPDRRGNLLQVSLLRLVRRGAWGHAGRLLEKSHPADVAQVLDRLTPADCTAVFNLIRSAEVRAEVIALIEFSARADLLLALEPEVAAGIVSHMPVDDAAELLRELPRATADSVLGCMGEDAEEVEKLLGYADETAGAIMSPEFLALDEDLNAMKAIERVQQYGSHEASFYVYVVNDHGHLVGVLSLRQLIMQPPDKLLRDVMTIDPIRVSTDDDQEDVAAVVARYDLLAAPVVDVSNKLVGVVTVDDVIDVLREEATEDILKLAGTTTEEVTSPGMFRGAWIRFPWLAVAFVGGFAGIHLLSRFEDILTETVQIAFFLPIILAMGGNVASQCSMVVVRGLSTGRLEVAHLGRVIGYEVGASLLLALVFAMGLAAWAVALGYGDQNFPLVVALGIFASIMIAATFGTLLPLVFTRLGVDPAIASGPFVTTSTDVAGILAFCGIAYTLL
ncbi:MAG: magnesium transporter [bacterium]|nr:magnesium transporter [bacterium]